MDIQEIQEISGRQMDINEGFGRGNGKRERRPKKETKKSIKR